MSVPNRELDQRGEVAKQKEPESKWIVHVEIQGRKEEATMDDRKSRKRIRGRGTMAEYNAS